MKIVGIITEYNPFHKGHLFHLNEAKKNADLLIAVVAGNFTMRGEFSPIDKWLKVSTALEYGIDLIIELPLVYAVQSADNFALASVSLLNQLGVNEMCFGSECNDLKHLKKVFKITKTVEFNSIVKNSLDEGFSYPKAMSDALGRFNIKPLASGDQLNLAYLRAIDSLNTKIVPRSIQRQDFASASQIRNMKKIAKHVPKSINNHFKKYGFNSWERYKKYLFYKQIISTDKENIFGASEGIENSSLIPNKRYTQSRINRFLIMDLLNIKKNEFDPKSKPPYIRVLGMNKKGQTYLNKIKKNINLITNAKNNMHKILDIELRASKIYALEYHLDTFKREFEKPIIIK